MKKYTFRVVSVGYVGGIKVKEVQSDFETGFFDGAVLMGLGSVIYSYTMWDNATGQIIKEFVDTKCSYHKLMQERRDFQSILNKTL